MRCWRRCRDFLLAKGKIEMHSSRKKNWQPPHEAWPRDFMDMTEMPTPAWADTAAAIHLELISGNYMPKVA